MILAGTTENIHKLDGKMDVYVTHDVVKQYYASLKENYITVQDLETHNIHCVHENHNYTVGEDPTEEPEAEGYHTESKKETEHIEEPEEEGYHTEPEKEEEREHNHLCNQHQLTVPTSNETGKEEQAEQNLSESIETKEQPPSQHFQHHGLLRSHTLFPIHPTVPFHHHWKHFQSTVPATKYTEEEIKAEQDLEDSSSTSSEEQEYYTADQEEEDKQSQRDIHNISFDKEQSHSDKHDEPTISTLHNGNDLEEQIHFLCITHTQNKNP